MRLKSTAGCSAMMRRADALASRGGSLEISSSQAKRRDLAAARARDRARELVIEGGERRRVAGAVGGQRLARDVEHGRAVEPALEQPDQRLRRGQPVRELRELGRRQIQEAVALEELAFAGEQRRAVALRLRAQLAQQRGRELVGARRRRRIDDDQPSCGRAAETRRGTR